MTNEEFNRKMEFIVWQQAQFSADMIEIREAHWRVERSLAQTSDHLARATAIIAEHAEWKRGTDEYLAESERQTDRKFEELAESHRRIDLRFEELAESHRRTDKKFEELAESQKRTDKKFEQLAESQKRTDEWLRQIDGRRTEGDIE